MFPSPPSFSAEDALADVQKVKEELKQRVDKAEADKQNHHLKMSAEIDDLCRTKSNLEERLIELIKYEMCALSPEQRVNYRFHGWMDDIGIN